MIASAALVLAWLGAEEPPPAWRYAAHWNVQVAFEAPVKLSGCFVGDVDPRHRGNEIVAVGADGSVYVTHRGERGFATERACQVAGEGIQCLVADVDPDHEGAEIVLVGMAEGEERADAEGAVTLVRFTGDGFAASRIATREKLVHGLCLSRGRLVVVGYDRTILHLEKRGDEWLARELARLPGPGKTCSDTPRGIVVACSDGSLVRIDESGATPEAILLEKRETGRSRLGAAGERLLVADDDGTLTLFEGEHARRIYRARDRARGAGLADFDPASEGLEVITAGYDRDVVVIRTIDGEPAVEVIFSDTDRFHHVASGQLDDDAAAEAAIAGFSGRLLVVDRRAASE
jgi:hypothetical protein